MKNKIGIIILATAKYIKFIPDICESIRKYFMTDHDVTIFVLTDAKQEVPGVVQCPVEHHKWPLSTLLRYHKALQYVDQLEKMDYIFQCDADMLFVAPVGNEILSDLTATIHPGFWNKPLSKYPYEKNPASKAFVKQGKKYYAGGFVGGTSANYIKMAKEISANIDEDTKNNLIAIWHDESHLQAYLIKTPPSIELTPSYCYPESWQMPFPKKLLALDKNHQAMRTEKLKLFL